MLQLTHCLRNASTLDIQKDKHSKMKMKQPSQL